MVKLGSVAVYSWRLPLLKAAATGDRRETCSQVRAKKKKIKQVETQLQVLDECSHFKERAVGELFSVPLSDVDVKVEKH